MGEGEDGGAAEEGIPDYHDPYEPLDHHAKGDLIIKPLLSKKPTKAMLARRVAALPASNSSSNSCSRMARLIGWLPGAAASLVGRCVEGQVTVAMDDMLSLLPQSYCLLLLCRLCCSCWSIGASDVTHKTSPNPPPWHQRLS